MFGVLYTFVRAINLKTFSLLYRPKVVVDVVLFITVVVVVVCVVVGVCVVIMMLLLFLFPVKFVAVHDAFLLIL